MPKWADGKERPHWEDALWADMPELEDLDARGRQGLKPWTIGDTIGLSLVAGTIGALIGGVLACLFGCPCSGCCP